MPAARFLDASTFASTSMITPEKSSSGMAGLAHRIGGQNCAMMLPPGLSDAWVVRTRTSVGHFRLGFSRFGDSVGTLRRECPTLCISARTMYVIMTLGAILKFF